MIQGLQTSRDIAKRLGITRQAVFQRARLRGLVPTRIGTSSCWTDAQAAIIGTAIKPGRPARVSQDSASNHVDDRKD